MTELETLAIYSERIAYIDFYIKVASGEISFSIEVTWYDLASKVLLGQVPTQS